MSIITFHWNLLLITQFVPMQFPAESLSFVSFLVILVVKASIVYDWAVSFVGTHTLNNFENSLNQ